MAATNVTSTRLTPTHRRMLAVLADGMPHKREELRACLWDELGPQSNVWAHISTLRKYLQERGQTIVCEYRLHEKHGPLFYRHVRLLTSSDE